MMVNRDFGNKKTGGITAGFQCLTRRFLKPMALALALLVAALSP